MLGGGGGVLTILHCVNIAIDRLLSLDRRSSGQVLVMQQRSKHRYIWQAPGGLVASPDPIIMIVSLSNLRLAARKR